LADTKAFGRTLKLAREQLGTPLDFVSAATRISRRHLEALEREDLDSLPRGPFGRSYLRAYAEYLGLDPEPLLDSYRSREADRGLGPEEIRDRAARELSALAEERSERFRPGPRPRAWHGVGLLCLLFFFAIWRWEASRPVREPAPPRATPPPPTATSVPAIVQETAPPKPFAAPAPPEAPEGGITVRESALGSRIVNHAVADRRTRFAEGEPVVFWTRVLDGKPGDFVHHFWLHGGETVMRSPLPIGGPHWRTFSRYTLPPGSQGTWTVEARDEAGRVLAAQDFTCVEASVEDSYGL
jgi:hypothetical protein